MRKFSSTILLSITMVLLLTTSVQGITRIEGIIDFVDSTRVNDEGFANRVGGELSLESTADALRIYSILGKKVNNSLDILYFVQTLHDESGGFSSQNGSEPSLESTIDGIYALQYLDINQTQYLSWNIFPFLNQTAQELLLTSNNGSISINELDVEKIQLWRDYLVSSFLLAQSPQIPVIDLINRVKSIQYLNGSYPSFTIAIESILLLNILNEDPRDPDLAKKFILKFQTNTGAFSENDDIATIQNTYMAISALSTLMEPRNIPYVNEISKFIFTKQVARSGFRSDSSSSPDLQTTYQAIEVLRLLDELDELNAPDVLMEVGFISVHWIILPFTLISLTIFTRRKF